MIVTAQPEATEAGACVLMRGGNAVDAAMAAALVQGVVDPQMCGIAGFGTCQIYDPYRNLHRTIDFHGRTPLAAREDMWAELLEGEVRIGFGFILKGRVNDIGYQSIATPGSLLAYYEAAEQFGTWDWKDICAPAIEQARQGFRVRPHVQRWWTHGAEEGQVDNIERLAFSETGRSIYFRPDGGLKKIGDRVENPDLANTLERIARHGAAIFYSGEIAEEMTADIQTNGGLLSIEDLRAYRTVHSDPARGSYRGYDIFTSNPPGGGLQLIEMLNILENFDLASLGHNTTQYIRILCEAMKAATVDKDKFIADPLFVEIPEFLTDKNYAAAIANGIREGRRITVPRLTRPEARDTTQVCVVDGDGMCVSMTHSNGMPSGVIVPGLGFMLNGCMGVFDPRPGNPGSIAPGKSRFSAMCPTIVFDNGEPCIVIGAPGGTQISMGVMQAILNVLDFDMTMSEAVSAPRFSATSDAIDIANRIPNYTMEPLIKEGYAVTRSASSYTIAGVHGISRRNGRLCGGADPGLDGMALEV